MENGIEIGSDGTGARVWTGIVWLRIENGGGLL
jgi:hypothetical protein